MATFLNVGAHTEIYFTAHPQDNYVVEGGNAYFSCEYERTSSIQNWMINGE